MIKNQKNKEKNLHFVGFEGIEEEIKDFQAVAEELQGNRAELVEAVIDVFQIADQRREGLRSRGGRERTALLNT